jgi:hypothetical protein
MQGTGHHRADLSIRVTAIGAAVMLALPMLASPVAAATTPLFGPYAAYSVGSSPEAVAIGDVTGDGRNDVVMTTGYYSDPANDYRLFIFAQTGAGLSATPVSYATAATYTHLPQSIAIGDVTGDGRADVVIGLSGLGIEIFPQTSSGTLGAPRLIATADSDQIKLGYLNGDKARDIVGIGWGTNTVSVFLNDGAGNMNGPTVYDALHGGYDVLRVGDVSGDGRDDIVVMSGQLYADPNISVLVQQATGGFAPAVTYSVGGQTLTTDIAIGDVTGDGRNDLVVAYGGNQPNSFVGVLGQTGAGTLAPVTSYASLDCPQSIVVADVDGDGRQDVVVLHGGWNAAGVYRAKTDGTLGAEELYAIPYATSYQPDGLAVGDVNGDGLPDLAIADYNHGLVVLSHTPTAPSAPAGVSATGSTKSITVTWSAPSSHGAPITGYRVYRGTASGSEGLHATVSASKLNYADTAVARRTTYYYRVSAVNAFGEGPLSAEVKAAVK